MKSILCRVAFSSLFAACLAGAFGSAAAQPAVAAASASAPGASAPLPYPSVAAALKAIESGDGNGFIVTHPDGWTIANEPAAAAQWSFTPSSYFAYPAVVRRVIRRSASGEVSVEIGSLCEAPKEACERMIGEFEQFNERIRQSVKSRQRPTPPPPPGMTAPQSR